MNKYYNNATVNVGKPQMQYVGIMKSEIIEKCHD